MCSQVWTQLIFRTHACLSKHVLLEFNFERKRFLTLKFPIDSRHNQTRLESKIMVAKRQDKHNQWTSNNRNRSKKILHKYYIYISRKIFYVYTLKRTQCLQTHLEKRRQITIVNYDTLIVIHRLWVCNTNLPSFPLKNVEVTNHYNFLLYNNTIVIFLYLLKWRTLFLRSFCHFGCSCPVIQYLILFPFIPHKQYIH